MEIKRISIEQQRLETARVSAQIGKLIKQERKRKGITQEKLAEAADISEKHLSSVENGRESNISIGYVVAIALALNVPLLQLISVDAK
ncbi:helix-turn-helix domain-containing protein [Aliamphritea spongicola]|uniref:helix-turn-helix domain-containing protein n=1 Tax=Aliamphritea spongicola TaxID=707589 RepID=UPI00196B0C06|nr:helix-turn-helix transcriptional regulator [Aliamphritea spongicola]MBN3561292.1 helix-turn-helix transcriptional regulator [Aliamphritea spongicola]